MTQAAITAEIVTLLSAVSSVPAANVDNHYVWANTFSNFRESHEDDDNDVIHHWDVRRLATKEEWWQAQHVQRTHQYELRGLYSLDDAGATETTFQSVVEDVMLKFRRETTLTNNAQVAGPAQLVEFGEISDKAGVLLHQARIQLVIIELITTEPR